MSHADLELLARIGVGFAVAYVLGFERYVRGSPAGDRTFALVGSAATAITAVAAHSSPQAIAGVITGLGFIGGGIVFHRQNGVVSGVTTAASLFAVAAVGIVIGYGHLLLGLVTGGAVLLTLEIPHLPLLRRFDGRAFAGRFANDPVVSWNGQDDDEAPEEGVSRGPATPPPAPRR